MKSIRRSSSFRFHLSRTLKRLLSTQHRLHLHPGFAVLSLHFLSRASLHSEALVTLFVRLFKVNICRWSWSYKNSNAVAENISLCERPMAVDLGELPRREIFSCSLASAHQEYVVEQQGSWIWSGKESVNEHSEWHSVDIDRM
jgi:hypothetical protein